MAVIVLPFRGSISSYDFDTAINGVTYTFLVQWNYRENAWYVNVSDPDGNDLIDSVKLCLGAFLGRSASVSPFKDGVFVALDTSENGQEAGFDDLGSRVVVKFVGAADLLALQQLASQVK